VIVPKSICLGSIEMKPSLPAPMTSKSYLIWSCFWRAV
jgi:hypothetical protein